MEYTGTKKPCRTCGGNRWYYFIDQKRNKVGRRCAPCMIKRSTKYSKAGKHNWNPESRAAYNARVYKMKCDLIYDYFINHGCTYCNEQDPMFLDFDHVRGTKLYDISNIKSSKRKLSTLLEEIAKCDVTCCRCHRFLTAKRSNSYYYRRMVEDNHPLVDKFKDIT